MRAQPDRPRAQCYLEAGRIDDAIAQIERSLELVPNAADQHYELGVVLLKANRLDAAAAHFQRAVSLNPDDAESYNSLGTIAYLRGASDEAIRRFQQSIRIHDNALAHFNLGRTLARAGRRDDAVAQYQIALAMKPGDVGTRVGLGAALVELGRTREAITYYQDALRLKPDLVSAMTDLAWILATAADYSLCRPLEAVRLASEAVRLTDAKNAVILDTLAASYFEAGRREDAIRTEEMAVDRAVRDGDEITADRLRARLRSYQDQSPR